MDVFTPNIPPVLPGLGPPLPLPSPMEWSSSVEPILLAGDKGGSSSAATTATRVFVSSKPPEADRLRLSLGAGVSFTSTGGGWERIQGL